MKKITLLLILLSYGTIQAQTTNYVINYNGSSNYINVGATVGNGVRSIEFWFKPSVTINSSTSITGYTFLERNDGSQIHEYGAYIKGSDWSSVGNVGHLAFFVRYSGTLHEVISNSSSWNAGTWYHVAGVIDPTTGMRLYINGVLQTSTDAVATLPVETDNVNSTYLGTWGNIGSRSFNGEMDELRFWNRSLTPNEIQTKMCKNLVPANETGLRAYWKFNEGSGTQAIDATTNAYNGIVSGATWLIDNPCSSLTGNYVINYNGSSNSIYVGTTVGNSVRSIEFWFKPSVTINSSTSITGYTFLERNDGSQLHEYGVYVRGADWAGFGNEGHLAFFVRYSGTLHEIYSNANSWIAGTWYHVAGVIDPTAGMKLYINGVLQTSTDAAATLPVETDTVNATYLGTWGNIGSRYFNGEMDELRFWNRSLTQNEIQTKMCQNLVPSNETGLQAYWEFNEGSGAQIIDSTTNAYNGTVNGATWILDTYCSGVGIENNTKQAINLFVYPNPNNGNFTIETTFTTTQLLQVFDVTGKMVLSQTINGNANINADNIPNGLYNVKITDTKGVIIKRIIIAR